MPSSLPEHPSAAAAAAKSLQSCPTLCDPIDGSPSGSTVPGILQARPLEWVAISFSNAWKWKVKVKSLSCVRLLATPWTAAYQAPPSTGFSRQEYWSGVPLPSLEHPSNTKQKGIIPSFEPFYLLVPWLPNLRECKWESFSIVRYTVSLLLNHCEIVTAPSTGEPHLI